MIPWQTWISRMIHFLGFPESQVFIQKLVGIDGSHCDSSVHCENLPSQKYKM